MFGTLTWAGHILTKFHLNNEQQSSPSLFKEDGQEVYKDFVFFLQKGVSVSNMTKIVVFGYSARNNETFSYKLKEMVVPCWLGRETKVFGIKQVAKGWLGSNFHGK